MITVVRNLDLNLIIIKQMAYILCRKEIPY